MHAVSADCVQKRGEHESFAKASPERHTLRGALCLDLDLLPGAYDTAAWSVDRLYPAERGHRMLALGFAELLGGVGIAVPYPPDLDCSGGRQVTTAHHVGWLIVYGLPWLVRRGADLLPHAAALVLRDLFGRPVPVPSRCVR